LHTLGRVFCHVRGIVILARLLVMVSLLFPLSFATVPVKKSIPMSRHHSLSPNRDQEIHLTSGFFFTDPRCILATYALFCFQEEANDLRKLFPHNPSSPSFVLSLSATTLRPCSLADLLQSFFPTLLCGPPLLPPSGLFSGIIRKEEFPSEFSLLIPCWPVQC